MNIALLHRLREANGDHIAWPTLRSEFPDGERDLDAMEAFGYVLERHPYCGVAYRGPAARLSPDQIEWCLDTRRIGRRVAVWNRVASTNDLAAQAAASRANDGLVILAEEQTNGRGRHGRTWSAPHGTALLMSVLVFPPPSLNTPGWLTALGAVAVAELAEELTGRPARIKWPNDVRIDGRKIAGILVERGVGSVIGIGLNVNMTNEDFPEALRATSGSLRPIVGRSLDRSELARGLVQRLDRLYEIGHESGPEPLDAGWKRRLEWLGEPVQLETRSGPLRGILEVASLREGLRIDTGDGDLRIVPGSEVVAMARDRSPGASGRRPASASD